MYDNFYLEKEAAAKEKMLDKLKTLGSKAYHGARGRYGVGGSATKTQYEQAIKNMGGSYKQNPNAVANEIAKIQKKSRLTDAAIAGGIGAAGAGTAYGVSKSNEKKAEEFVHPAYGQGYYDTIATLTGDPDFAKEAAAGHLDDIYRALQAAPGRAGAAMSEMMPAIMGRKNVVGQRVGGLYGKAEGALRAAGAKIRHPFDQAQEALGRRYNMGAGGQAEGLQRGISSMADEAPELMAMQRQKDYAADALRRRYGDAAMAGGGLAAAGAGAYGLSQLGGEEE